MDPAAAETGEHNKILHIRDRMRLRQVMFRITIEVLMLIIKMAK